MKKFSKAALAHKVALSFLGSIFAVLPSAVFFTFGYMLTLRLFCNLHLPFLESPPNFGQFGFTLIYFGVFGGCAGLSVFFRLFFGRVCWSFVFCFLIVAFFYLNFEFDLLSNPRSTVTFALIFDLLIYGAIVFATPFNWIFDVLEGPNEMPKNTK